MLLRRWALWQWILAGMAGGVVFGAALAQLPPDSEIRRFGLEVAGTVGEVFLRLITMVMVPLVMASLVVGMATLGDPKKLGRIGLKTITYFLVSTAIAVAIGVAVVAVVRPGERLAPEQAEALKAQYAREAAARGETAAKVQAEWTVHEFVKGLFPRNIVDSMARGEMLPIIFFSLLVGLAAMLLPDDKSRRFQEVAASLNEIMLKMVEVVMWAAPIGVLALMTKVILSSGLGILVTLAAYGLTVLLGLAIQFTLVYPLAVRLFTKLKPLDFLRALREVHLTAFSTSSSAATLPVNIRSCETKLGVPPRIAGFILPLGATVNMDGTALYQGVAVIFIAQVYGIDLSGVQQLSIILTATLASIGAAPVPGAGMVMLAVIMAPLGLPTEGIALIFGIDRFLDMCRTVLNVTSDAACAVVVAASEGEDVRFLA